MFNPHRTHLAIALFAAGILAGNSALAVRVNPDGHGQALIYPYYTARSTASGKAFVTALSVTNQGPAAKAVRVRFLEGKMGAPVLDFNLFMSAYDVWTAGIVRAGAGAGIFSRDNSCTVPRISTSSASPTRFRNAAYVGDLLGDSMDRTYEGYFELLEMATIEFGSALELSVTQSPDFSSPNASRPSCAGLPTTDTLPTGLVKPTGGLTGNVSYINVNEGTDYSVDALALTQWSDRVQWSATGNAHPNLADASPATSYVVDSREDGDMAYFSAWASGRDAVTAVLMTDRIVNDYSIEASIKAATDWMQTLPTKKFYANATGVEAPFAGNPLSPATYYCQPLVRYSRGCKSNIVYYDREALPPGGELIFIGCNAYPAPLCGVTAATAFSSGPNLPQSGVLQSTQLSTVKFYDATFTSGYVDIAVAQLATAPDGKSPSRLIAPPGATTIIDLQAGTVTPNATVTYFGLPLFGFAVQSYSTSGLPGVAPNVLSNYGGLFTHKYLRKIEVQP